MVTRHQVTQWRKRLERKGWIGLKRAPAPRGGLIEYHVIRRGWLYSGRCQLSDYRQDDWAIEGTLVCMLERRYGIVDGVWRRASPDAGPKGGIVRLVP